MSNYITAKNLATAMARKTGKDIVFGYTKVGDDNFHEIEPEVYDHDDISFRKKYKANRILVAYPNNTFMKESLKDKTDYTMKVEFTHPTTNDVETVDVDIPFSIFVAAIKEFCDKYKMVTLDGTDNHIWNLFSSIENGLDYFADNEAFIEICKEKYKDSSFEKEDFENWLEDYNFVNDID